MKTLFIGSASGFAGKSLAAICLGKILQEKGLKVGFFKPFGTAPCMECDAVADEDAVNIKRILNLEDPVADISPLVLTHDLMMKVYKGELTGQKQAITSAYERICKGKDIVLIGGGRTISEGRALGVPSTELIKEYDWPCLVVDRFYNKVSIDILLAYKNILKNRMKGLILNRLEDHNRNYVEKLIVPFLAKQDIPVVGLIPNDTTLSAVSVNALCTALGGELLSAQHAGDMLVHNFVVGAMNVEQAHRRFRKRQNKAVITGGDRVDLQVAALETSTSLLILTGGISPHPMITAKAEELGVPVIVVSEDTMSVVGKIEELVGRPRMREQEKVDRALQLFRDNVDLTKLGF
jgi:BioD-like phosphotransacetylase family protein